MLWKLNTHPSDERPHTGIDARPASQVSRFPAPIPAKARWSFSQLPAIVTCDSPGEAPRRAARARHFSSQISIPPAAASKRRRPSRPAAFTRAGLSAVTLEPLRPRAAHVVQLRSIAAVRQGGSDGPDNGQEIHPLFPTPFCPRMFWPQLSANAWNLCGDNVK